MILTRTHHHSEALGYLYSSVSLTLIRPENARAVLAGGCLLGGMDDLCQYAYDCCRQSINVDTVGQWLEFVDRIPAPSDGSATPQVELSTTSVFGPYGPRLKEDVFNFLVVELPNVLHVHQPTPTTPPDAAGRDMLLQIYSRIPFDMFKAAVESSQFGIGE